MVKKIVRVSSRKEAIVLTAKGRDEWKDLAKRGIIKKVSFSRRKNKDFGLHWKIKYTATRSVLR